jgi:molybdate transport system substrate-binding protein
MASFGHFLDDSRGKGIQIPGISGGYDAVVHDHGGASHAPSALITSVLIDLYQVRRASRDEACLDQQPGCVADRRDHLLSSEEILGQLEGLVIDADRVDCPMSREEFMPTKMRCAALVAVALSLVAPVANATEVKVLSAGAFKQVVLALVPKFQRQTGNTVTVDNGTTGQLKKRIDGGEAFDIVVITPAVIDEMIASGKVAAGSEVKLAGVGIGVVVKEDAPKPDISTVEKFKQVLLAAKSVAYIDPASGGSSGIYIDKLLVKLGIADQIRPKAKLKKGGHVADFIVSGEAELGIHQISEIVPVKGVTLVGPLPTGIQNTTTYAAGMSAATRDKDAAKELIEYLSGPDAAAVLKSKGMEPVH